MENTKTTFRPILFSTPMVQAILEGRKTMTRRTKGLENFNQSLEDWIYDGIDEENGGSHYMEMIDKSGNPLERYKEVVPAYNVGDVLWVRETFFDCSKYKKYPLFENTIGDYIYKSNTDFIGCHKWKPSLFMPKEACRIFLKVKSIKVEKLQDISEEDIKKEGVQLLVNNIGKVLFELGEKHGPIFFAKNISDMSRREVWLTHWAALWCKINGMQSWMSNPFVFVYEFDRIEKPLDFLL